MAISRFTEDCDVYVYRDSDGVMILAKDGESFGVNNEQEAAAKLQELKTIQPELKIPDWIIETLQMQDN